MTSLDCLLDELARYVGAPEHACVSLPPNAYLSDLTLRLSRWRRSSSARGCASAARNTCRGRGDYYTIDVMGEPVVIVRGADGVLRALNTACRHRAMPVVTGKGNARRFVCPYHSWTYGTDGRLIGAPHMEGSTVFKRGAVPSSRLPPGELEGVPVRQSR